MEPNRGCFRIGILNLYPKQVQNNYLGKPKAPQEPASLCRRVYVPHLINSSLLPPQRVCGSTKSCSLGVEIDIIPGLEKTVRYSD